MEADYKRRIYRKADLIKGDLSPAKIKHKEAIMEWHDEWLPRWEHEQL